MKKIAESDRLFLREMTIDDAEFMLELNNDPEVLEYTGDLPFLDIDQARSFLQAYDQYTKYKMGRWAVIRKSDNKILGWSGLKYHSMDKFVDLGFRFFKTEWNKGYATESALLALNYGIQELGLVKILGRADQKNYGSIRVLEKIGMRRVSYASEHGSNIIIMEFKAS